MIIRYPCSSVSYQNIGAVSVFALKQTRWSPETLKMRDFADRRAKKHRKTDTAPTKRQAFMRTWCSLSLQCLSAIPRPPNIAEPQARQECELKIFGMLLHG